MEIGHKRVGNFVICDHCGVFETMSADEFKAVVEVVLKFPDAQIDDFFNNVGLIYETPRRRGRFKALTPPLMEQIKKEKEDSEVFITLNDEHPKEKIIKSLEKLIKQNKRD